MVLCVVISNCKTLQGSSVVIVKILSADLLTSKLLPRALFPHVSHFLGIKHKRVSKSKGQAAQIRREDVEKDSQQDPGCSDSSFPP